MKITVKKELILLKNGVLKEIKAMALSPGRDSTVLRVLVIMRHKEQLHHAIMMI
jgi:hypothetical protein